MTCSRKKVQNTIKKNKDFENIGDFNQKDSENIGDFNQKDSENIGDFSQKDFEVILFLCIFAPKCDTNKKRL